MNQAVERQEFDTFDMTCDGFKSAKKWLVQMALYDEYINSAEDTSGFGVVAYANWCHKQHEDRKAGKV